uniref:Putative c-type lectin n=1 Tax=Phlebotomus kandelakii TaxID=1109342 RepID=A0A6B2E8I3_9DIPT
MEVPKCFLIVTLFAILISCGPVSGRRTKRMYAMCPPKFVRLGNECYYISNEKASWLDAHFECKDRNSKLAEPFKFEDYRIRKYLLRTQIERTPKWIGGIYNWERKTWQWGYNGRAMKYQAFSQMKPGSTEDMKFHCSMMNPTLKFRWSAKPCVEQHNFICQHRMPYVSERNRQRVYAKWNETFPNELANEIEVIVTSNPHNQTSNIRHRSVNRRGYHINNLPNVDNLHQEGQSGSRQRHNRQGRTDHVRNPHRRRPAIVDIGRPVVSYAPDPVVEIRLDNRRHHWKQRQRVNKTHNQRHHHLRQPTTTPTTTTPSTLDYRIVTLPPALNPYENQQPHQPTTPSTTTTERPQPEEKSHHHREHHHHHRKEQENRETYEVTTTSTTTTTTEDLEITARKQAEAEKKIRRDELRQRLSRLSPEKQRQYILMRKKKLQKEKLRNETA